MIRRPPEGKTGRVIKMASTLDEPWQVPKYDLEGGTGEFLKDPHVDLGSSHPLKAGDSGERFVDFDQIVNDPAQLEDMVAWFKNRIQKIREHSSVDFLVFIDKGSSGYGGATVGAIVLASALSLETYLPFVLVRSDRQALSQKVKMPAIRPDRRRDSLMNLTGTIITDHIGEGREVLDAIEALRRVDGKVSHCVSFTCREKSIRKPDFDSKGVRVEWGHSYPPDEAQVVVS